ncbi:MAG: transcription elongation factor GreAB [Deltaproteobacteria bacterium]|nr:transcription elongation factor GreAB [Deltaproteobacteria bacterium]
MADASFTSLAYYIDREWMQEAYRRTRKDGAAGVDNVTAEEYEKDLDGNLLSLLDRFKSGSYSAPPVKRVYIPKGDGKLRPIGIPALEDKVLQRAVVMVLTALYEQDFLDCSYGFRPGRSVHQALEDMWREIMRMGGCWVLEVDIKSYFDTVGHEHLRGFLRKRVRDGVILRTIGKWLKAGVMEDGALHYPREGTPQGGVMTPRTQRVTLNLPGQLGTNRYVKMLDIMS